MRKKNNIYLEYKGKNGKVLKEKYKEFWFCRNEEKDGYILKFVNLKGRCRRIIEFKEEHIIKTPNGEGGNSIKFRNPNIVRLGFIDRL